MSAGKSGGISVTIRWRDMILALLLVGFVTMANAVLWPVALTLGLAMAIMAGYGAAALWRWLTPRLRLRWRGALWLALAGVVLLQIVAVHWAPAQVIFDTVDLSLNEWLLATAVASSVLFIEELRKLLVSLVCRSNTNATTGHER